MSASVHRPHFQPSASDYFASEFMSALDVAPDDRIGPPRSRRIGLWIVRGSLLCGLAGAGYLHYDDPARWPRWWADASAFVAPLIERSAPVPAKPLSAMTQDAAPSIPDSAAAGTSASPVPSEPAVGDAPAQLASATVERTIAPAPAVAAVETEPAATAAPAAASRQSPPSDPNRARAAKVGLNPDISPVVLARLTSADYRNAGVAIRRALAETADESVFYWPVKVKSGVAQFQIHFVPGADAGCRRYVVTVAKDGWATTALPMDDCKVKRAETAAGKATAARAGVPSTAAR